MGGKLTKIELYAILTGIFTASIIISNTIASKTFAFYTFTLPCAVIIFPLIYIINDILSEVYGFKKARNVILLGFFMNIIGVICYNITIALPAPSFFQHSEAFNIVLGSTLRLLIAGFIAYLIGSIINAKIMVVLKKWDENKLFLRCIVSTFFGESLDALIFITIGFIGTMPFEALIIMIIAQSLVKTIYEVIAYPLTKTVINYVKKLPEN